MSLHYKHFAVTGHPKSTSTFAVTENSWHVYLLCSSSDLRTCYIYNDAINLEKTYKSKYKNMMRVLGQNCESGKPLNIFYNEKECHPILTIKVDGNEEKIWRIRQGELRLCFVYLPPEKRLILLRLFVKNDDRLKKKEKSSLKLLAEQVITDNTRTFALRIIP